jgi:peptide/nickel transport system substrate-binding protein
VQREPTMLGLRPLRETFAAPYLPNRTFNADFAVIDAQGVPQPYLVEALPKLGTDTWKVSPDGKMETTYHFRPNLSWHDGTPFSAEDYVFGWRVYTSPEVGFARAAPFESIESLAAPDANTLVIQWSKPYPDAAHLAGRDRQLPALPRHLLQETFENSSVEEFANLPYWTRDYVGLGPYRLDRWELGSYIEASAFDGHAGGRAKIDRVKLVFIGDRNTALANALSGEVQALADNAIQFEDAVTLRDSWAPRQAGSVIWQFNTWRAINFQFRRAFVRPESFLDVRVRKALAHATDKTALNDVFYHGVSLVSSYVVAPVGQWGDAVKRDAIDYAYDPRLTEQYMRDAGYARGSDGVYTSPTLGRFSFEFKTTAGPDNEKELAAIADGWGTAGFDVSQSVVPNALAQDLETRAGYSGMYLLSTPGGDRTAVTFTADNTPLPENRWRGGNRSGWANPDYTRVANLFQTTLEEDQRKQQLSEMARIFTDDVGAISLYFRPTVWTHVAALKGPGPVAPETDVSWNIAQWELD